jgi:phosphoribosylanthranilate isomerase
MTEFWTMFEMTWVKICGMTNLEDALTAVEAGADAVGFVFYEKSPRKISVEAAREIVGKLPEGVEKIGVFVGVKANSLKVLLDVGLNGMQIYPPAEGREESGGSFVAVGAGRIPDHVRNARFLTALPMNLVGEDREEIRELGSDFATLGGYRPRRATPFGDPEKFAFLLDSGDLRQPGGTGKKFDWNKAVPIAEGMREGGVKLVVAGGLTAENVVEAIGILKPWGVDVASGVEARPGKKDPEKVRAFVKAVRGADLKAS